MRRLLFTLAATGLLIVLAPAAALAQHHHHHATHTTRAHRTRVRRFGDLTTQPTTTTGSSDTAGTVQSFSNGVLTILLNDNSTVSGTVTSDTRIECSASGQSQTTHDDGDPGSGTQTSGDDNETSSAQTQSTGDDDQTSGTQDQGTGTDDQGDDQGEDQGQSSSCSSADLTSGKVVRAAELRISSGGNTWSKVELVS